MPRDPKDGRQSSAESFALWQPPALLAALRVGPLTVPLEYGLDFVFFPHAENSKQGFGQNYV